MLERWESDDPADARVAREADGLLADFNAAGVLTAADVHVAGRLATLVGEDADDIRLAVALAVRAVRHGSVCVDLAALAGDVGDADLPWPEADGWLERVAQSPYAAQSVVAVDDGLLYLDRYWREERQVYDDVLARLDHAAPEVDRDLVSEHAERLFPGAGFAEQRAAALAAVEQSTTVITGGPGTGKTTTVAGLLALLTAASDSPLRIALTAPTGKAAARLQETVEEAQQVGRFTDGDRDRLRGLTASTLHRLLGWRPGSRTRFKHHRGNRLPHDVIVVDETSMVSLTMMARLLEAVRPEARLVFVGDPDQLASVEAGAVLSDLVGGLTAGPPEHAGAVAALHTPHRYGATIGEIAEALRDQDADRVLRLLASPATDVELIDPEDPAAMADVGRDLTRRALALRAAAAEGDVPAALTAADRHRLLCAHREGPWGVQHWNRQVERWLGEETGAPVGAAWGHAWYAGRPVLVTANDYGLGLFNGDSGVVVADGDRLRVVIASGEVRTFAPSRLSDIETLHAMTVHKSQGSQADAVTVLLPPEDSPLLTRELFYTAVTRARSTLRVIGTEAAVRAAVTTTAGRATGLKQRFEFPR